MLIFDPAHPVYSAIVEAVTVHAKMTILELHRILNGKMKIHISLPQVYRIVTRMIEHQILVKVSGKVSVNLMWISYVEFMMQRAKTTMISTENISLRIGEKRVYESSSLLEVEAIWNHILVTLYAMCQEKKLYKYYSHAWWQIEDVVGQKGFYESLQKRGIQCTWVFGSRSFLDCTAAKRIGKIFEAIAVEKSPFPHDGYSVNVYGDYVIECLFPENVAQHFSFFFTQVRSMEDFNRDVFLDLLLMKGRYKVTVWHQPKQAEMLRKKLTDFFVRQ